MLIANYAHRLPATHDMNQIRSRAEARSSHWSSVPDLYFKAFLLRERGRHGATANEYASLYLWRRDDAFRSFLTDGRFKVVTDTFGRPAIQTYVSLDARRGAGTVARFMSRQEHDMPVDADLADALAGEIQWCREAAARSGTVAAAAGVDTGRWRSLRIVVTENAPTGDGPGVWHEVAHLARPLLATLPTADA